MTDRNRLAAAKRKSPDQMTGQELIDTYNRVMADENSSLTERQGVWRELLARLQYWDSMHERRIITV